MPVEIKELIIKAEVQPENNVQNGQAATSRDNITTEMKEAIIQECIQQVMALLNKQKDR